jgi:imidazolonepropionase-like amidohydrolase
MREKAATVHRNHADAVQMAHAAGVRIFAGTDSCNTMPFGGHARELHLLVDLAGMSSMEALMAATSSAARALGIEADTGSLLPGKSADLLVVEGDPLQDVRILEQPAKIHTVMKAGRPTSSTAPNLALLRTSAVTSAIAHGSH